MKHSPALAVAALLGFVPAAFATEIESESVDTLSSVSLKEITVVAQRADSNTPIAFTNVTAADLARVNTGQDVPFLLMMTPSVVTTSDAGAGIGYSSIRIRGSESSRINVTANGVPVNDAESHNVYWVNLPDIASSVKDIQVQRGVGTSTTGAGAFGGSVNMATDSPSQEPFAYFSGTYGMYNTHKETLKLGTGLLGGHWTADARLSNIGTDGYIDRASSRLYSYFGQIGYYNGATSLRFVSFGGKEKTYMAWDYASKEQMLEYGRRYNPCGEYTDKDGNKAYYPNQYDNYATLNFQLLGKHRFNKHWTVDMALHFTKGDGYYEQYKTKRTLIEYGLQPFEVPVIGDDGSVSLSKVKKSDLIRLKNMDNDFGGGLFNATYSSPRLNLVFGAAANGYVGRHFGQVAWVRNYIGDIDPLQEYYRNIGHKFDASAYARASYTLIHELSAYADLQFRHIRYTVRGVSDTYDYTTEAPQKLGIHANFNFFNPKVGLNYNFARHNRVYGSWSVAHKEPTRDNFIDADPERLPTAERLFDYELGYEYSSATLTAGVNLYYMDYKDQLVATGQLSDTGNAISVNVPSSYRAGVELQARWAPVSWFDWQVNATLSQNRIKNFVEYIYEDEWTNPITIAHGDTRIAFSPDFTLNNSFNFNHKGFDASLMSHFVSRQYLNNAQIKDQSLDAYFVSDLVLGYSFKLPSVKEIRVGLTVNNIFNEKYESNGYSGAGYYVDGDEKIIYRYAGYAAQAPCHVLGSVTLKF